MSTRLTHPIHGTKIANMDAEVKYDIANGWSIWEAPVVEETVVVEEAPVVEETVVVEEAPVVLKFIPPVKPTRNK